jgi:hypothetical protein
LWINCVLASLSSRTWSGADQSCAE